MAADQGVTIADDGVAEVSMTDARANLTRLIREVRYGLRPAAFTERGERSAYVVPAGFYEQATSDRALLQGLHKYLDELATRPHPDAAQKVRIVRETLEFVGRLIDTEWPDL
jgi:prevent-host-death family protein